MNIEEVMRFCRFSRCYHGYKELIECVQLAFEKEERLLYVTGIYQEVAKKHHISASGVERNIRTMIRYAWKNGGREPLEKISGGKLYEKPTVSDVMEILVCYLKAIERQKRKAFEKGEVD